MLGPADHINISVTDINSAISFFVEKLGLILEGNGELAGPEVDAIVGLKNVRAKVAQLVMGNSEATRLHLIQYIQPAGEQYENMPQPQTIGFAHLAFRVEDIEKEFVRLQSLGVTFMGEIMTLSSYNKKMVYFRGPDNLIFELCQDL